MQPDAATLLLVLGRALLGGLFIVGGIRHLLILPIVTAAIAARGIPAPRFVLLAGTAFEVVAGVLLLLGLLVPWVSLGLAAFTVAASAMLVNFWDMEGPAREAARNTFLSNLAIIGGLFVAAAQSL